MQERLIICAGALVYLFTVVFFQGGDMYVSMLPALFYVLYTMLFLYTEKHAFEIVLQDKEDEDAEPEQPDEDAKDDKEESSVIQPAERKPVKEESPVIEFRKTSDEKSLLKAVKNRELEVVQLLIADGAPVDAANSKGVTALMFAVHFGHEEIVRELLQKGADVSARSDAGMTAFSIAQKSGNQPIIELLKKAGAKG